MNVTSVTRLRPPQIVFATKSRGFPERTRKYRRQGTELTATRSTAEWLHVAYKCACFSKWKKKTSFAEPIKINQRKNKRVRHVKRFSPEPAKELKKKKNACQSSPRANVSQTASGCVYVCDSAALHVYVRVPANSASSCKGQGPCKRRC